MKKLSIIFLLAFTMVSISQVAEQWVSRYTTGGSNNDEACKTAVDASGNVYAAGTVTNPFFGTTNYYTIKYNPAGIQVWAKIYAGPDISDDKAVDMAVDASGNVYVTGFSSTANAHDYVTVKYNTAGVLQWEAFYNGTGDSTDEASSIAVDAAGNVYVTGWSYGNGTNSDYATIKYNSAGVQQWAARYSFSGNNTDEARSVAVDAAGNVYVTGNSRGSSFDYATIKYNSQGNAQWVQRYDGTGNVGDYATSVAVDAAGNVLVAGSSHGLNGQALDYATVKYNSSGAQQWASRYDGGVGIDEVHSLVLDAAGNVYVTGWSYGNEVVGVHADFATVKYNTSGVQQWVRRYTGPAGNTDEAHSIAVDAAGNIYVAGFSNGIGTSRDYTTLKYSSSGIQLWQQRYNGPGNGSDDISSVAVDASGNVYVTGYSSGSGTGYDYCTIKYSPTVGIQPVGNEMPSDYSLGQNYPNPFNPVTNIKFQIPNSGYVKLVVFDIAGKEVSLLVNQTLSAGTYNVDFDGSSLASGTYFCRLEAGGFAEVKKMILIK